jgi:hypothetical protein
MTTEERLCEAVTAGHKKLGFQIVGEHAAGPEVAFLCRELDDIRAQLAKATEQLAMMGIQEPPPEGVHVHSKRFSGMSYNGELAWICSECLEQGCDYPQPTGPTYNELLAKKRSGGQ